jgi:ketosteroid isomerase-like protein
MADLTDTSFNLEQLSNTDVTVHAYGDTVIVTAIYRAQGTASGKPFVHRGRFMDVWLRQNGKWQCVANQETHLRD